jgi:hypothetical protein
MKHARKLAPIALALMLVTPLVSGITTAEAAPKREKQAATSAPAKRAAYRQFTGTVVAIDGSSITVEKGGKSPKQMTFARAASMRSADDVAKDVHVTVYWRDEAGKPVAHRIVVKTATSKG